jgi:hypothetical protein
MKIHTIPATSTKSLAVKPIGINTDFMWGN